MQEGYLNTKVTNQFYIEVSDGHELYVEECGNHEGQPVIFLHGGPGGSISEKSRRFFNPEKYRIILFDQRGTGQSKPFLSINNNTIMASAEDMEVIRQALQIDRWIVFGGSYGSTLALYYSIQYPEQVEHLVLRGIFLGRQSDIDWLFQFGASEIFPQTFNEFKNFIEEEKQDNLVKAYYELMTQGTEEERSAASKAWNDWEFSVIYHLPKENSSKSTTASDLSIGVLESHYFSNQMFWEEDNYLLEHANKLSHIPIDIVHGRYDVDCRVSGAYELQKRLPHAKLHIVEEAGHSPYENKMLSRLIEIMDQI